MREQRNSCQFEILKFSISKNYKLVQRNLIIAKYIYLKSTTWVATCRISSSLQSTVPSRVGFQRKKKFNKNSSYEVIRHNAITQRCEDHRGLPSDSRIEQRNSVWHLMVKTIVVWQCQAVSYGKVYAYHIETILMISI